MPYLVTKRGKKRYRATIMVAGVRKDKLFPDATRESLKRALEWEESQQKEMQRMLETGTGFLSVETWMNEYLDEVKTSHRKEPTRIRKRFSRGSFSMPDFQRPYRS